MKENKGKEASEGKCLETQPQDQPKIQTQGRPTTGDKRKSLPKNLDLEGSPVVETKERSIVRPKWSSLSLLSFILPYR